MGNAYELGLTCVSYRNTATTSIAQYTFVRQCTTLENVDLITTRGLKPFGIAQETITPGETGNVAIIGISRLRMCSTGYTSLIQNTTSIQIGAAANGRGARLTTTTLFIMAQPDHANAFAASDIIAVRLQAPTRFNQ